MGIGPNIMQGLFCEAKREPFAGACYTLGRPTMGFSPAQTNEQFRAYGLTPVGGFVADDQIDETTSFTKQLGFSPIKDVAFFRALGFTTVKAIDISDFEGAEIILDLNKDVPPDLIGTCDLLVDGSTLDNLFDPITALRNAVRLLTPNGRLCLSIQANYSTRFTGIPYLIFTPIWLYDFFVANRFTECNIYATIWDISEGHQTTYVLNHEHATRRFGGGIIKPVLSDLHLQLSVFARRGADSTFDRSPNQHVYRSDNEWEAYETVVRSYIKANTPPHIPSRTPMTTYPVPPGWFVVMPNGAVQDPESGRVVRTGD